MSELIEEDVVDGCTRAPVAIPESLSLVHSISSEAKEIARWI
jgi:hypothetical protein